MNVRHPTGRSGVTGTVSAWAVAWLLLAPGCMPGQPTGTSVGRPEGSGGRTGSGGGVPPLGTGTGGRGGSSAPGVPDGGAGLGGSGGAAPGGDGPTAPADDAAVAPSPDAAAPDAGAGGDALATDAGPAGPLARGLRIGLVEAAQGVFVPLARNGAAIAAGERKAHLIEGRPLFVRVHVVPGTGFSARRLRAVLTVADDGAGPVSFVDEKPIAAASRAVDLASTFNFFVPAETVRPSSRISTAVYETAAVTTPEPTEPPRYPASGEVGLGIKAGKMELDLVMVRATGVGGPLIDSPERRLRLEKYLFDVYPVQKVNVRWREPVMLTKKISRNDGFTVLQQLRTTDAAKPHEYYHLLVAVEDTVETLLGIAASAGATPDEGARRVAMTFVRKRAIDSEMDTVSHEMGHNHGRAHVAGCSAQGIDAQYPYGNTAVGVDGFSLSEKAFKPAAMYKDLMGYCYPTWISDYTFAGFGRRVRAVSAFSSAGMASKFTALAERSLQGFVLDDGAPVWGLVTGALVPADVQPTRTRAARIFLRDGQPVDGAVTVQPLGEDLRSREIAVALPASGDIARIEVRIDGRSYALDPSAWAPP